MGAIQAQEMAELMDSRTGMAWHLTSNHYPPVPVAMVDACLEAIEAGLDEDWERPIQLPIDGVDRNGEPFQITWRGQAEAPAWAIIEGHHLGAWLEGENK